jgi:DNA gyrase/topoisomerase IV subunit A
MKYSSTTDFIKDTSRDYSIYVCQSRGIPSVSDGLKDAQRKSLFVMKSQGEKIKTISLAGKLISENIYLHGDAAACDTISLMAAPYCNNIPLLSGIGAFGTRVGPSDWGAPRYTYVKKSTYTDALIYQDYDIIPLKENYDGSVMEPKHFLPLIPVVLLNGVSGIAVGWSTEIMPRSLEDLIDATLAAIDGKKKLPSLLPKYEYLKTNVRSLGDNQFEFTGKVIIDGSSVIVTELPPDLSLEKFKARLNKMEDEEQIQTYIDRSTKEIHIEVRFKRGSINDWTETHAIE